MIFKYLFQVVSEFLPRVTASFDCYAE